MHFVCEECINLWIGVISEINQIIGTFLKLLLTNLEIFLQKQFL